MKLQRILGIYFITLSVYLLLDFLWLDVVAKSFYQNQLGEIIGYIYWPAAFVFYLIYTAGLVYLIIWQNIANNAFHTALRGGFFGFIAYCTYDLTNLATINNWPIIVVITDVMWGFLLSFVTSLVVIIFVQKSQKNNRKLQNYKNPN